MNQYRPKMLLVIRFIALTTMAITSGVVAIKENSLAYGVAVLSVSLVAGFIAAGVWWVFDSYAWRWDVKLVKLIAPQPNLNGRWEGLLDSPHTDGCKPMAIEIRQTFSTIRCDMWTDSNGSHTVTASLVCTTDNKRFRLLYTYTAEALEFETAGHNHYGTARLDFSDDESLQLRGIYFTGRNIPDTERVNNTRGRIYLTHSGCKYRGVKPDFDSEKYMDLLPTDTA